MSTLSKHGTEVGRIEGLSSVTVYMNDGTVHKDSGNGWRCAGRVRECLTPADAYERAAEREAARYELAPCLAAYRRLLHSTVPQHRDRRRLHVSIAQHAGRVDDVLTDSLEVLCLHLDEADLATLCGAYRLAHFEATELLHSRS
ncbi:hypothetical protein [Metallibacterium scheffleri]|uniref:hypothetical protein n=1 Tax=Metallibacterium scheffleri TaxID=993689 RepID=UPI00109F62B2|nr:hypothetical protein [Metallibacterium scheffleri]